MLRIIFTNLMKLIIIIIENVKITSSRVFIETFRVFIEIFRVFIETSRVYIDNFYQHAQSNVNIRQILRFKIQNEFKTINAIRSLN